MQLSGKTALITGGSSGIGLATARLFLAHGAQVAITGVNKDRLAAAAAELGSQVLTLMADARDSQQTAAALDVVGTRFGSLDILFVNAGIASPALLPHITEQHVDDMFHVNVRGALFTIQHAVPLMPPGSSIILNTSWLGNVGLAGTFVLSATKAALRSLARSLSSELLPKGIRVNAVSPGAISTGIYDKMQLPSDQLQRLVDSIQSRIPVRRFGTPEEIANAVLFLAGSGSSYLLGVEVVVDGGLSQC